MRKDIAKIPAGTFVRKKIAKAPADKCPQKTTHRQQLRWLQQFWCKSYVSQLSPRCNKTSLLILVTLLKFCCKVLSTSKLSNVCSGWQKYTALTQEGQSGCFSKNVLSTSPSNKDLARFFFCIACDTKTRHCQLAS